MSLATISGGRLFHNRAPATAKAWSPTVEHCDWRTLSWSVSDDRRCRQKLGNSRCHTGNFVDDFVVCLTWALGCYSNNVNGNIWLRIHRCDLSHFYIWQPQKSWKMYCCLTDAVITVSSILIPNLSRQKHKSSSNSLITIIADCNNDTALVLVEVQPQPPSSICTKLHSTKQCNLLYWHSKLHCFVLCNLCK